VSANNNLRPHVGHKSYNAVAQYALPIQDLSLAFCLPLALFRIDCMAVMSETAATRTAGRGGIKMPVLGLTDEDREWMAVMEEEQFICEFKAKYGRPPKWP